MAMNTQIAAIAAVFAIASMTQAADLAGEVEDFDGEAQAIGETGLRALDDGDDIFAGDRITTGDESRILIRFRDETTLAIGENGELTIDAFVFDPSSGAGEFSANMAKGVFRYLSGQIAQRDPNAVSMSTVWGTIGVRGTHVLARVGDGPELIVLLPQDDPKRPPAIAVSNSGGAVLIDEMAFGTEIAGPGIAPTPPRRYNLQIINSLTRTLGRVRSRMMRPGMR